MAKVASKNLPGASYNTRAEKWQARIEVGGQRKHLGYYETAEAASQAYLDAKGTRAKVQVEKAIRERPDRPKAAKAAGPWQVDPETLAALVPSWMLEGANGQLDPDAANPFASGALAVAAQVSRAENVSLYTVCELTLCDNEMGGDEVARLRAWVRRLKVTGLIDLVSEVANLVASARNPMTFDEAVLHLSGAADLV